MNQPLALLSFFSSPIFLLYESCTFHLNEKPAITVVSRGLSLPLLIILRAWQLVSYHPTFRFPLLYRCVRRRGRDDCDEAGVLIKQYSSFSISRHDTTQCTRGRRWTAEYSRGVTYLIKADEWNRRWNGLSLSPSLSFPFLSLSLNRRFPFVYIFMCLALDPSEMLLNPSLN